MSKKLFILISFVLALALANSVFAQGDPNWPVNYWSGWGDGSTWGDANNWYTANYWWDEVNFPTEPARFWTKAPNSVPDVNRIVNIGQGVGWYQYPPALVGTTIGFPVIDGETAVVYNMGISTGPNDTNGPGRLDVISGSLTSTVYGDDWSSIMLAFVADGNGVLNQSGGTIVCTNYDGEGGYLGVSGYNYEDSEAGSGVGTLNMTGGEFYCYHLDVPESDAPDPNAKGYINLYGGTLYCTAGVDWTEFWMGMPGDWPDARVDITDGRAVIETDETYWLNVYIDEGKITPFGNDPNLRAEVYVSYDALADETTLQAISTEPNQAWNPTPRPGITSDDKVTLSWTPGDNATSHVVYFGTDKTAVENGTAPNTPTGANSLYTGVTDRSTQYYWQVTEVGAHPESPWPGLIWEYRTADYLVVDNFDYAKIDPDVYDVWDDWWVDADNGMQISALSTVFARSGKSLQCYYDNSFASAGKYLGSWIDSDTTRLDMRSDWGGGGTEALVLHFYGQPGNNATANDKMYVQLQDTSSVTAVVVYDGDSDDVNEPSWHEWNIDMSAIDVCGVSLANIDKVRIGFGGKGGLGGGSKAKAAPGGQGYVYFEDMGLYPTRCVPAYAATDVTGDCITGYEDIDILARDWLRTDGEGSPSSPTTDPLAWYQLDDSGTPLITVNSGSLGSGADGVLATAPNNPSWVTPGAPNGPNPTGAMDFGGNDYVTIPELNSVKVGGLFTNHLTITAWVKRNGIQTWWAGMVFCTGDVVDDWVLSEAIAGLSFGDEADWLDPPYGLNEVAYHWANDSQGNEIGWMFRSGLLVPDGLWTFVAVAVEPTEATLYMSDGNSLDAATNFQEHIAARFDEVFYLGRDPRGWDPYPDPSHTRHLNGQLDDVRIYD
ncbi:MAG: LamG-like jellyroll fold domain-containing protein, partial [Planctomycetota bacterium]